MNRGLRLWRKWDARVAAGDPPHMILPDISDESLLELLATGGSERRYACNLLLTEALNRLARTRFEVLAATDVAHALTEDARRVVTAARQGDAPRKGPGSSRWLIRRLDHDRALAETRLAALRRHVVARARADGGLDSMARGVRR